jgi:hypothetical protein
MVDNVIADSGDSDGATFATDDVGGVHYPLTKITLGAEDANDGPVASGNPMPVAGTVTANLSAVDNAVLDAIAASAAIMDDWDESDRAKANIIVGQAGIAAGAGAVAATVPRVTLASDDPGVALLGTIDADTSAIKTSVELIDNAIAGSEMQVDVVAALPAGSNAIGKLAANSGVDIGDVDVTSLPDSIQGPASPDIDSYAHIAINLTTGANQVLVSSAASKQIWVYSYAFSCGDAAGQSVSLQDEDDNAVTGIMEFAQYGGISVPPSGNFSMPIFKLATNKDLEVDITGGDVDGWLAYAIVSV